MLLSLINTIRGNSWSRLNTLLPQCFLIHTAVDKLALDILLSFFILVYAIIIDDHSSLLIGIGAVGSHLLLLSLIHGLSAP